MKFAVYQIQFSEADVKEINSGQTKNTKFELKTAMQLDFDGEKSGGYADQAFAAGLYTHVANITAEDFNDVFEVGNIGPSSSIERLGRMSSVSVGDIIIDEEGSMVVVTSYGFTLIGYRPELVDA